MVQSLVCCALWFTFALGILLGWWLAGECRRAPEDPAETPPTWCCPDCGWSDCPGDCDTFGGQPWVRSADQSNQFSSLDIRG